MSERHREEDRDLARGDAELVRQIAESYRPPEPPRSARAAFRDRLDARIRRRAARRLWMTGAATAGVAAALVLLAAWPATPPAPATESSTDAALLALALPAESEAEPLPADYQAIEDLLLEGEGV
jgi:hypothetical protein